MIDKKELKNKLILLADKYTSSQIQDYRDSIFYPYITLSNVKSKGSMMEEFFEWYLQKLGIKCILKKTNENYDFLVNDSIKIEFKVASIGQNNVVSFNQLHFGKEKNIDKFLLSIIKPDDTIDFFVIPKKDFINNKILIKKQHSHNITECARINGAYDIICENLSIYRVSIDSLRDELYRTDNI